MTRPSLLVTRAERREIYRGDARVFSLLLFYGELRVIPIREARKERQVPLCLYPPIQLRTDLQENTLSRLRESRAHQVVSHAP